MRPYPNAIPVAVIILIYFQLETLCLVPKPLLYTSSNEVYSLLKRPQYVHNQALCFTLHEGIRRFDKRLQDSLLPFSGIIHSSASFATIRLDLSSVCNETEYVMWPSSNMNESYKLNVTEHGIELTAVEVWGLLYGLETLSQLIYEDPVGTRFINASLIIDTPRFIHRGFLIDTSRHFLSSDRIKQFIDAMAMVKMNVLHWHIVDDQSFPYMSYNFPELSQYGTFDPIHMVYTVQDIRQILHYARLRGVRVMPEFDTPGHTQSWGASHPELLAACSTTNYGEQKLEALNPARNATYDFVLKLLQEVMNVFPDSYLHLGGDEVSFVCWKTNSEIKKFMKTMGFAEDYKKLEGYYIKTLIGKVREFALKKKPGLRMLLWEDLFNDGFREETSTVMHIWKSENWKKTMNETTAAGYPVLLSACWYLNYINYGVDWHSFYECDPTNFGGTPEQLSKVIGGEAAMWGEYVDDANLFSRSWPRAAAVAEPLWTVGKLDKSEFAPRMEQLRCRMLRRGWPAEPVNGPGFCL